MGHVYISIKYKVPVVANCGCLGFSGGSVVKNPPANLPEPQEMWVQSLGWKDSLKKEMATHSSIVAWEIPWTKEPGRLHS